ncbi:MAG TPA: hypothetical protein VND54_00640 [Candidatus Saccharimonadales bacterium]|jgi:hypothetical protein|nr:hypothetical protein [Candidatus Saccharimonadales bacterium]
MRLGAILLANAAEMGSNGLIYVLGGGWDTVNVAPGNPISFNGAIIVRLLADRAECGHPHGVEIRLDGEDGELVFRVQNPIQPVIPEGFPVAWEVPFSLVIGVGGPLPRLGLYRFSVLVDNQIMGTAPMRAVEQALPGAPVILEIERPPQG